MNGTNKMNTWLLSFRNTIHDTERMTAARETADRLIRSSALLANDGEFILRAIGDTAENFTCLLSSASDSGVTSEDLGWIFRGCAETAGSTSDPEDVSGGERRTYFLNFVPVKTDKRSQKDSEKDRRPFYELFGGDDPVSEAFDMLARAGAAVTATVRQGRGEISVCLPGEMPLRIRTAISIAFPGLTVGEGKSSEISGPCFSAFICHMLDNMMQRSEKDEKASDGAEYTPLEELGLSIRTYNCLRRASITTVEDLRKLSNEDLMEMRNLGPKGFMEIKRKLFEFGDDPDTDPDEVPAYTPKLPPDCEKALGELIGLDTAKEQIRKVKAYAKLKKTMEENGDKVPDMALNMAFVGNPGTAKTTVARLTAGILRDIGLLSSGDIVEVCRADLVGKYVGHTADKVSKVFERAKGKVLFIDEAYSLVDGREGEFGDEAINTIVREMENRRGDTVVIFAGYPDKMDSFLDRNPGLRSRVPFKIRFDDYSADEMLRIVRKTASDWGFTIGEDAEQKVGELVAAAVAVADPRSGNGRYCRNLVEAAIINYSLRVEGEAGSAGIDLTLRAEDFTKPTDPTGHDRPPIGFAA